MPNDAVVFISCTAVGPKQGNARHRSSTSTNALAGTSDAHVDDSRPSLGGGGGGGGEEVEATPADDQEGEEEVLALAALTRIRESYRARARAREAEVERRGVERDSPEEIGKRLLEKKRRVESTAPFREVRRFFFGKGDTRDFAGSRRISFLCRQQHGPDISRYASPSILQSAMGSTVVREHSRGQGRFCAVLG